MIQNSSNIFQVILTLVYVNSYDKQIYSTYKHGYTNGYEKSVLVNVKLSLMGNILTHIITICTLKVMLRYWNILIIKRIQVNLLIAS